MSQHSPAAEPTTRERILEAALDLFARHGFAGTSIRQLAREVGLRESSIYNHFAGKEAILHSLVEHWGPSSSAARLKGPAYAALADDPAGYCRRFVDDLLVQWYDPHEHRLFFVLESVRHEQSEARERFHAALFRNEATLLTAAFRHFALTGLIAVDDPRETARLFAAGCTFVRMEHLLLSNRPAPPEVVRKALERFLANFLKLIGAS